MKVGDYVRIKNGLNKIIEMDSIPGSDGKHSFYMVELDNQERIYEDEIIKSSPNIIDLIEVGDYINGHRVAEIETLPTKQKLVVVGYGYDVDEISENNIKSILTKEQFESMEYKLGDDK